MNGHCNGVAPGGDKELVSSGGHGLRWPLASAS